MRFGKYSSVFFSCPFHLVNQSINRTINQSINRTINRLNLGWLYKRRIFIFPLEKKTRYAMRFFWNTPKGVGKKKERKTRKNTASINLYYIYIMANFIDVIGKIVRPYFIYILVLFCICLFGVIGYYTIGNYITTSSQIKLSSNVANANPNSTAYIYLFYVDWCPHCKTAMPEWDSFAAEFDGKQINNYKISCIKQNCTDETSDVQMMMEKYKIESFPTVVMLKNGIDKDGKSKNTETINFDSKIKNTTLTQFVNTMLVQDTSW